MEANESVNSVSKFTDVSIPPDPTTSCPERNWRIVQLCRNYKVPSFLFPGVGIVYTAFHPILVGKVLVYPLIKCGLVMLASYPIATHLFIKHYNVVRKYIGPSYPGTTAAIIAVWGVLQAGWFHYIVLDPLLKRDRKKLLNATVNDLQPKALLQSEGIQPVSPPRLRHWRITTLIVDSFSGLIGLVLPKTTRGFRGYILRKVVTIPFYMVPIVGPLLYSFVNSVSTAQRLIQPYLKHHLNLTKSKDQDKWLKRYAFQLRWFGFVADLLESIPGVGILFSLTNTVGAAIWLSTYHPIQSDSDCEIK